jgi:hypothetical protein
MQPSCAKLRSRVPSLSAFLVYVDSLPSLTSRFCYPRCFLFLFLCFFHVQVIGALAGLTDALEDDVKAGLRTNSRRCAVRFALLKSFTPANKRVGDTQDRQPGKHQGHHCSRDRALEFHLRAARRQVAR